MMVKKIEVDMLKAELQSERRGLERIKLDRNNGRGF